jgi:hypothetical protein
MPGWPWHDQGQKPGFFRRIVGTAKSHALIQGRGFGRSQMSTLNRAPRRTAAWVPRRKQKTGERMSSFRLLRCSAWVLGYREQAPKPRTPAFAPLGGEGGEPVRHSGANGPERSEGAQGKLREPGEGVQPAIFEPANELSMTDSLFHQPSAINNRQSSITAPSAKCPAPRTPMPAAPG